MNRLATPDTLGLVLEEVLSERGYLAACKELGVVREWPGIAGERLAEVSECTRVEQGVLYVRVASAPWRQEIHFMKNILLEKIRSQTSCQTINDIVFY